LRKFALIIHTFLALVISLVLLWPGVVEGILDVPAPLPQANPAVHQPVVQQLVDIVAADPVFRAELEAALLAQEATSYWHGKTLDDMYTFFDEWVVSLPHIDDARQYMDHFYEFADAGLGQQLAARDPLRGWLYQFMLAVGRFNDSPASAAAVPWWTGDPRIDMADYIVPPGGYQSFNDFFTREIKPGARTIDSPLDPAVFVSPADSSLMKIADRLTSSATIGVKGENLNIDELLGHDPLAPRFVDGKAVLCMLNTTDYHRYHAPAAGQIVSQGQMAGLYYGMDGGWVEYFFQHRRGYFIFDTPKFGYVAMVCVGMFTISSVNFITSQGDFVSKGDALGNFAYGGSAIILLFEPGRVSFTVPLEGRPVHVDTGQGIAMAVQDEPVAPASTPEPTNNMITTLPGGSGTVVSPPVQIPVLMPNISVTSAGISTSRAAPGEHVIVSASVINRGTVNGSAKVSLYINGQEESSRSVTLAGGAVDTVIFNVQRSQPGNYRVHVGAEEAGSFMVEDRVNSDAALMVSMLLLISALVLGLVYAVKRISA